jgi:steroid delta-isomerase-like uncharacterized protein
MFSIVMTPREARLLLRGYFVKKGATFMSIEDNKAIARRGFEEVFTHKNVTVLDKLAVADFTFHSASRTIQGREAVKQFLKMFLTAFPDLSLTIEDLIGEGDCVSIRYTNRGTHQAPFMGMAPTGKSITVTGLEFLHLANGKVIEEWINEDFLEQLGVVAAPAQASPSVKGES